MLLAVSAIAAYANRDALKIKIASVYAPVKPKVAQSNPPVATTAPPFVGDAPWALSALPECFSQTLKATSRGLAYVTSRLPRGAAMVRPPATLRYADCTVLVRGEQIDVRRGTDRLRVPPPARLYVAGTQLALLRGTSGGYELRVYDTQH